MVDPLTEQCDGGPCCTLECRFAEHGTECGQGPCDLCSGRSADCTTRGDTACFETRFVHSDHLGSVVATTSGDPWTLGKVMCRETYGPYGESLSRHPCEKRRYNGRDFEPSASVYDYGARYYHPATGRFISADTHPGALDNPQSHNRYAYVLDSPYGYTDPSGHEEVTASETIVVEEPDDLTWAQRRIIIMSYFADLMSSTVYGACSNAWYGFAWTMHDAGTTLFGLLGELGETGTDMLVDGAVGGTEAIGELFSRIGGGVENWWISIQPPVREPRGLHYFEYIQGGPYWEPWTPSAPGGNAPFGLDDITPWGPPPGGLTLERQLEEMRLNGGVLGNQRLSGSTRLLK